MKFLSSKKALILPLSILLFSSYIKFSPVPIFIDEYATIFLSNGIPTDNLNLKTKGYNNEIYDHIHNHFIKENNSLNTLFQNTVRDGGNGLGFYIIIHFLSITIGKIVGISIVSRIFCIIIGILTLLIIYRLTSYLFNHKTAVIACIIFALSPFTAYNIIFIRTYCISALINLILIYNFIQMIRENNAAKKWQLVSFLTLAAISPFFHFFNGILIFIIGICIILLKKMPTFDKYRYLSSLGVAVLPFMLFYFFFNEEGRYYQDFLNGVWREYSLKYHFDKDNWQDHETQYGLSSNFWLLPTTPKYLSYQISRLSLEILSLDLNFVFHNIRMRYQIPILLLYLSLFIFLGKPKNYNERIISIIPLIYLIIYILLAIIAKHTMSLTASYYCYLFYPFVIMFIAHALNEGLKKQGIITILVYVYLSLIFLLYIGYVRSEPLKMTGFLMKENNVITSSHREALLLEAIERQFDRDTIQFIYVGKKTME